MKIEEIYFIVNFETVGMADVMTQEDDEYDLSDEEQVLALLNEEGLSPDRLNGSTAIMQNVNKKLLIKFDANNTIYKPSLLVFEDNYQKFIRISNTFLKPKRARLREVSPQIGGIIDKNYGIKFKIDIIGQEVKEIALKCNPDQGRAHLEFNQANMYIRSILGIPKYDEEYSPDIDDIIKKMEIFYCEAVNQSKMIEHNKFSDIFSVFYTREDQFFFGVYEGEYYAIIFLENLYLVYHLVGDNIQILCETKKVEWAHQALDSYHSELESAF